MAKIKTFLKIIANYGFLSFIALTCEKYKLLIICIFLRTTPYFIQAGLSNFEEMYSTNAQYISALGSQWCCLTAFGVYTISEDLNKQSFLKKLFQQKYLFPIFLTIFFLNSSEWRKSPIYPFRGLMSKENLLKIHLKQYIILFQ